MDAREVVVIITGAHKALAMHKCIEEGVNHMWTVSAIQMHPRACIVCDEDATLELRVKTVKYFKGLMDVHTKMLGIEMRGHALNSPKVTSTSMNKFFADESSKKKRKLEI